MNFNYLLIKQIFRGMVRLLDQPATTRIILAVVFLLTVAIWFYHHEFVAGHVQYQMSIGWIVTDILLLVMMVALSRHRQMTLKMAGLYDSHGQLQLIQDNLPFLLWLNDQEGGFPIMVWFKDRDGHFISANRYYAEVCGLTSGDSLNGKTEQEIWPQELADAHLASDQEVMTTCRHLATEEFISRRDSELWLKIFKTPLLDANGNLIGIAGFARDISERKRAELALRQTEEMQRQHLEELVAARTADLNRAQSLGQIGSWRLDVQHNILTWSDENHRIFGIPCGVTMTYEFFLSTIHPEDREYVDQQWQAALSGASYDIEHRLLVKGVEKWVRERAELEFDPQGQLLGGFGTTQDITSRKQAELALQRSEERYRLFIEQTVDGIFVSDANGYLIEANPAGSEMFGYTREEILRLNIADLIFEEDIVNLSLNLDHRTQGAFVTECSCCRKDSSSFAGEMTGRKLPDGQLQAILRDITNRKVAEMAREQALLESERLVRVRSKFLANTSHEIRTPLNAVLGLAQVGQRDSAGRKNYETFTHILNAGRLLLSVVNDILDFSKIEAGKLTLEEIPFLLSNVIDQVVDINAIHAFEKGLEFLVDEALDLPEQVVGDALRLSQVLVNLLSNAIKFTEQGRIVLAVAREAEVLVFRVSDTGIGMTEEQLTRLFSPFEQGDGSTTRRFGGTGLGLTISKRLVVLMGGEILVESHQGYGTVFEVRLPQPSLPVVSSPSCGKILLVGIESWEAESLSRALCARGSEVEQRSIGEACAACAMASARLVLLPESVLLHEGVAHAMQVAIDAGRQIALVHLPGSSENSPIHLSAEIARLKRPLRARQILNACREEVVGNRFISAPGVQRLVGYAILAAEDNEMNRLVLEEMLHDGEGAYLVCVENGRQAVERVQQDGAEAWDIVLMDIQMPEMDGHEATRRIREFAPDLPIIGLTAHALAEERERCLLSGMVDHISKPVEIDILVAAILNHRRPHSTAPVPNLMKNAILSSQDNALIALSENSGSPEPSLVDWVALTAQYQKKPAFITKLVNVVLRTHADTATILRTAATARDDQQIAFIAHKLKSVTGSLMAHGIFELAQQIEFAARQGITKTSTDPAASVLSEVTYRQAEELAEAMEKLLSELAMKVK